MSGTAGTVSADCPTDIAVECFKIPGYRYASYDNSAGTPCGTSSINGTVTGICERPNVRVTSWLINGLNVLPAPVADGWDNCAVPFLSDLAATLNTADPFAGNWIVTSNETCAYYVRSRALPASGIEYGTLTAVDVGTGETLTFEPAQTVVPDEYYRRIVTIDCDGSVSERWTDASGAVVPAPDPARLIPCASDITPVAQAVPHNRVRPRIKRYTGTQASPDFDDQLDVQSVTLTVLAGEVRVRAVGAGATSTSGPTAWSDDVTVPAGVTLTWGVDGDTYDLQLDGSLIFSGVAADADFIVHWTEHLYADTD
ncbi:hypothetical protein [Streptomyces sp. TRM68367]|uniref:hypothetical protein n=1 Tax=Streptomyces sp. TRM68367 TaxID=2758415 RepID=UPI00165B5ABF|nr:hypothetical protein [Streptomyces sp. TRM68367]MBC9729264.1 hypothetical protein [Streptomyces sp. TRM68367]